VQGSGEGLNNGDYLSDANGLNAPHRYFIEVPPGQSHLSVDIFDADIGAGGAAEATAGRDRARTAFNTSVNYSIFNPGGQQRTTVFTTGDTANPAGADNSWLNFFDSTGDTVRDNFTTGAYTNNDGLASWSTNWLETNDDSNAGAGLIQISGAQLRIRDDGNANPSTIAREANLTGWTDATLTFDFSTQNTEATDQMQVQVSNNGGASWTTLETFTGTFAASSRSYNINAYISANTRIRFIEVGTGYTGTDSFFVDNLQIKTSTIEPGHWEVRVDESSAVTAGDDINAFGLRAHDGTSGAGGTELNIYADSMFAPGVNPPASGVVSRTYNLYPYITSGCSCSINDFDYDSNRGAVGSVGLTSRTSAFGQTVASANLSADSVWARNGVSGWTSDFRAWDYGIWSSSTSISSYLVGGTPNGNYTNLYIGNFQAAVNPPAANPITNTFRIYLPTDAGAAPSKPYLEQDYVFFGGANPPAVGQQSIERIVVRLVNPAAWPITFSASNLVTANVPGAGVTYGGNPAVGQGTIIAQPAVGATGNVTWNPGTLASGATAVLMYDVIVAPTAAGQRVPLVATPVSGNGTRARFVDETGNTTQSRATYTLGPACELAVTESSLSSVNNCSGTSIGPGSTTLPNGTKNLPYNQSFTPAGTVQLYSGNLPGGLSVAGGALTGTPTQTGTFTFTVGTPFNPGFSPSGCATSKTYSLTITAPTAAGVPISGHLVSAENGRGIGGATVTLTAPNGMVLTTRTNPFGYYHFMQVEIGETYILTATHKNYSFEAKALGLNDAIDDLLFVALPRW